MAILLGDEAPNFQADTTEGPIDFHQYLGDGWGVLFSHPKDYTPVCTTELGRVAKLKDEFAKRNTKVIGLSVDPVDRHADWAADIEETQGHAPNYPMIGDTSLREAIGPYTFRSVTAAHLQAARFGLFCNLLFGLVVGKSGLQQRHGSSLVFVL